MGDGGAAARPVRTRTGRKPKEKNADEKALGRPTKHDQINPEEVYKLARLHATYEEMSDFLGVSVTLLRDHFRAFVDKGRAAKKISLRRMQWKSAAKGNVTMQIFLGKQYLGQSDKSEVKQVIDPQINVNIGVVKKEPVK